VIYIDPKLPREMFGWHSDRLHMHMPIVRYGNWGHPLLMLPTAQSDLLDCERFFLIKSVEKEILAGKLTIFCIESINKHAWMNKLVPVREKAHRQAMYSAYVEHEVVPHIRRVVQNDRARIGVTGASFGAFHAANLFFRRPDMFDTLIAMSGFYDLGPTYLHGFGNDDVYFNNPTSFVPGIEGKALDLITHHSQIHLLCGTGPYELPDATRRFSQLLWDKGIWHNADFWGPDMGHDWPTWRAMLGHYVAHRLGW
jgi:esterase/lipase superfamily enzyme